MPFALSRRWLFHWMEAVGMEIQVAPLQTTVHTLFLGRIQGVKVEFLLRLPGVMRVFAEGTSNPGLESTQPLSISTARRPPKIQPTATLALLTAFSISFFALPIFVT